jgi:hypothetical protein
MEMTKDKYYFRQIYAYYWDLKWIFLALPPYSWDI